MCLIALYPFPAECCCKFLTVTEQVRPVDYRLFPPRCNAAKDLMAVQHQELNKLLDQFQDVCSTDPGLTDLVWHDIKIPPAMMIRQMRYQAPEGCRHAEATCFKVAL